MWAPSRDVTPSSDQHATLDAKPSGDTAMHRLILLACLVLAAVAAQARDLTVATWNLGWHMSLAEARAWIAACSQPFALDAATGLWTPKGGRTGSDTKPDGSCAGGAKPGSNGTSGSVRPATSTRPNFRIRPVTRPPTSPASARSATDCARPRRRRDRLPGGVRRRGRARDLPDGGAGYDLCGFEGFKVQRLVIAARKALGGFLDCEVEPALSLPGSPVRDQPRPGLSATLNHRRRDRCGHDGSPEVVLRLALEANARNPNRGKLDGDEQNCVILQRQVRALEAWIETRTQANDAAVRTVLLGDFNRNLPNEVTAIPRALVRDRWFRPDRAAAVRASGCAA